jgi:PAS domain-containing protein
VGEPFRTSLAGGTLRHLEQLIGDLSAGVILIDLSGTIIWCNDAALTMHGVSSAEELGGTADEYATRFALSTGATKALQCECTRGVSSSKERLSAATAEQGRDANALKTWASLSELHLLVERSAIWSS